MINLEIIDNNLSDCWNYYKDYLNEFRKSYYSDSKPDDFIEWCENELYQCPNCGEIVIKDEQIHLSDGPNYDGVCDYCVEENGYFE